MDEYWEWVGVDWRNKVVSERAQRGGVEEALLERRDKAAAAGDAPLNDALLQRIMAFTQVKR